MMAAEARVLHLQIKEYQELLAAPEAGKQAWCSLLRTFRDSDPAEPLLWASIPQNSEGMNLCWIRPSSV